MRLTSSMIRWQSKGGWPGHSVGCQRGTNEMGDANGQDSRPESTELLGDRGRLIYGPTPPGGAVPCRRESRLSSREIDETVELIALGRVERCSVRLPERLFTRDWNSILEVMLLLDARLARPAAGWKIGGASEDVRQRGELPQSGSRQTLRGHRLRVPSVATWRPVYQLSKLRD